MSEHRSAEERRLRFVLPEIGVSEPVEKQRQGEQRDQNDDDVEMSAQFHAIAVRAPSLPAQTRVCVSIGRFGTDHSLLLFVGLLAAYNINLRQVSSHDTYASRFVPISILRDGDLILDEFVPEAIKPRAGDEFFSDYFVYVRGHYYDSHPPVGPLLALPVYALPAWIGIPDRAELIANMFSKLAASIMVALSAVMLFRASRRLLSATLTSASHNSEYATRVAFVAAIAYGLATSVWSTASLAMWTHTPAVLGFAVALWALTAGRPGVAGVAAAAAWFSRPATAPAVALLGLYLTASHGCAQDGHRPPLPTAARMCCGSRPARR